MVSELLVKYIWLVRLFTEAGSRGLSLGEIQSRWERRWGTEYTRRTFNNHRAAVEEVFGIEIDCNRSTNRYYVAFGDDLRENGVSWLINSFTVNNMLSLGQGGLAGRISVEDIPSGQRWLTELMEAMTEGDCVEISYRKYTSEEAEDLHLRPYALKEFEKRWYLVAWSEERGALRVYGLDRVISLRRYGRKFKMPGNFDVDELFATAFGIYIPEGQKAVRVELRATPVEARYLRDLPLHPSQEELPPGDGPMPCRFSLFLVPNTSLILELCRHGARLEVVSPESLRAAVAEELSRAAALYNDINQ